ncbi:MAG TPA: lipid-A-disaccharide synthase N-terminal domain-containing protein [Desulfobacteraceae bacterium]|nr:lipid-A-disaccharide synthase N-terminal domain-containing protein [Desulfobacteraceae bacterium]HPJ66829.1 lipid-A-disaccharide synthase N-terminal domain-containing protein [Desulfobacteraceae bacterium]HPQ29531.1 lipid-A-disaccharide synthase N-terminal domain-containing protein [Desulfobacteraceae bacterium]
MSKHDVWLIVGFAGQAMFSMRFIIQWLKSERMKKSVIPIAFWYFSVAGGAALLLYAIHRKDPVFIVGQGAGLFIYARNLYFIFMDKKKAQTVE